MKHIQCYADLPWNHEFWNLLRYFRSLRLRSAKRVEDWFINLRKEESLPDQSDSFPVDPQLADLLESYLSDSAGLLRDALDSLRDEKEAKAYCKKMKFSIGATRTKNKSHHQSSKALIAAVSGIAQEASSTSGITVDLDPQRRVIWLSENGLHVSARNLDGAIPSLENPSAIWEIKEYWGKTKGGSKMSDAVYECHLVGLELRMFEAVSNISIDHIVFVDGKEQWSHRKSDLLRFIDLHQQGLIDHLIVGREVESEWRDLANEIAAR